MSLLLAVECRGNPHRLSMSHAEAEHDQALVLQTSYQHSNTSIPVDPSNP